MRYREAYSCGSTKASWCSTWPYEGEVDVGDGAAAATEDTSGAAPKTNWGVKHKTEPFYKKHPLAGLQLSFKTLYWAILRQASTVRPSAEPQNSRLSHFMGSIHWAGLQQSLSTTLLPAHNPHKAQEAAHMRWLVYGNINRNLESKYLKIWK